MRKLVSKKKKKKEEEEEKRNGEQIIEPYPKILASEANATITTATTTCFPNYFLLNVSFGRQIFFFFLNRSFVTYCGTALED